MRRTGYIDTRGRSEYLCTCGYTGVSGSPDVRGLHSLDESTPVQVL